MPISQPLYLKNKTKAYKNTTPNPQTNLKPSKNYSFEGISQEISSVHSPIQIRHITSL